MIGHLRYLGLLLPLSTFSSWAAEQNPAVHIAPAGNQNTVYGPAENFTGRVHLSSNRITTSLFPGLMSPLNPALVPPGIRIPQVSG